MSAPDVDNNFLLKDPFLTIVRRGPMQAARAIAAVAGLALAVVGARGETVDSQASVWPAASAQPGPSVPGVLDLKTGAFRPFAQSPSAAAAATTVSGRARFVYSARNVSFIAVNGLVNCTATLFITDGSGYDQRLVYLSPAIITTTNVSCSVDIIYTAKVDPTTGFLLASMSIDSLPAAGASVFVQQTPPGQTVSLPVNGATTVFTFQGGAI